MHSSQVLRKIAVALKLNNQQHDEPYLCCAEVDLSLRDRVFGSILLYPWRVNAAPTLIVEQLSRSRCSPSPMLQGVRNAPGNQRSGFAA
jgi:hypothetical protein